MLVWETVVLFLTFLKVCFGEIISDNGVYSGITVGFHPDVLEEDCEDLVQSIQNMFNSASGTLSTAIPGLSFGSVSIIIPATWATCGSQSVNNAENLMTWNTSTIRVGGLHPVFGYEPWTQQPRGCGMQADFISMSTSWLLNSLLSDEQKGSRLVHEWAKYRWGVFEEYGHYGDPIFPESYRGTDGSWQPNFCTDSAVSGGYASECQDTLDCDFVLSNSSNITSSLMAIPQLVQVTNFCTSLNHKSMTPSKQNTICNGSSTWDIIAQHPDILKQSRKNANGRETRSVTVDVWRENPRFSFVIAFETSQEMDPTFDEKDYRFHFERESIAQFIMYEAPYNTRLGLVSFNNEIIQKPLTRLDDDRNRQLLADFVLKSVSSKKNGTVNLLPVIEISAKLLSAGNGIIVLLTKCTNDAFQNTATELAAASNGNAVWVILYPMESEKNLQTFKDLATLTGGAVLTVQEKAYDQAAAARQELSQAFRQLVHLEPKFDIVQIDSETCNVNPCNVKLMIPKGYDQYMWLYVYSVPGESFNKKKSSFKVTDGNTCIFNNVDHHGDETTKVFSCVADTTKSETTIDVTISEYTEMKSSLFVEVVGQLVFQESLLRFHIFGSRNIYDLHYTNSSVPVIYAQLFYNDTEVLYAYITFNVAFDPAQRISYDVISLADDGIGADVTGNDGIYSAYLLPVIPVGEFSIQFSANDNNKTAVLMPTEFNSSGSSYICCGSVIPLPANLEHVPTFNLANPSIKAKITESSNVDYPPGTIKDLMIDQQQDSANPVMTFTATGKDLDYGTADHYVVKYIFKGVETIQELQTPPSSSGSKEMISLPSISCNTQFTISIYAVDNLGQRGGDSNRISYYVSCPTKVANLGAGALAGIIIACLFFILIIILIIYIIFRDRGKNGKNSKYSKFEKCACCSKEEEDGFYRPSKNSTNDPQRPPVQEIKTIKDLWEKRTVEEIPQYTPQDNPSAYSDSSTTSTQFMYISQRPDVGDMSLDSSRSPSPFGSEHSINKVGIPVGSQPYSYGEQTTLPVKYSPKKVEIHDVNLSSSVPSPPRLPPRKIVYNTQV